VATLLHALANGSAEWKAEADDIPRTTMTRSELLAIFLDYLNRFKLF
jgi:hypothetical protein